MTYRPLAEKLKRIQLLLLDVDGVLTDGAIIYGDDGNQTKIFNAKDGLGIRLLMDTGVKVGIVTGRRAAALDHRCRNLGIGLIYDGVTDKAAHLNRILKETGLSAEKIAFMGDDLPDLPLMKRVGIGIAVADAHGVVRKAAAMVTGRNGGAGAVREVCEAILKAQGHWDTLLAKYQ